MIATARSDGGRSACEMATDTVDRLADRGFRRGKFAQRVEQDEVVNCTVVAYGIDAHSRLLELTRISLTLVAKRVVLGGDDECRR